MKNTLDDMRKIFGQQWTAYTNNWLLLLFSVLWLLDCGLTIWATNNGYLEIWNQWTQLIGHTWLFVLVKLLSLAMFIWIVRWAQTTFPYVIFIALVVFNILIGTVTIANIIMILK